jgi:acyl-CoA thioesterase I
MRALRAPVPAIAAIALLLALALAALPAPAQERVIVAFGDSLTAGFGVAPGEAYPARLEARLRAEGYPYRVVNAGVSGDTSAGGLRRVDWALRSAPEVAIVVLGANDGLRGQNVDLLRANLGEIVARFQAGGARVLLGGMRLPPNYGAYGREFERVFPAVAQERRTAFVPFFLDGVGGVARLNLTDGIHPTAEGYRVVVEHLLPQLRPLLRR